MVHRESAETLVGVWLKKRSPTLSCLQSVCVCVCVCVSLSLSMIFFIYAHYISPVVPPVVVSVVSIVGFIVFAPLVMAFILSEMTADF